MFVKAGIPIVEALEVIGSETTDKVLKTTIVDMIERLEAGDTFASAASAHPEAFPDYYLGILGSADRNRKYSLIGRSSAIGGTDGFRLINSPSVS